jgi:hypothetical protein
MLKHICQILNRISSKCFKDSKLKILFQFPIKCKKKIKLANFQFNLFDSMNMMLDIECIDKKNQQKQKKYIHTESDQQTGVIQNILAYITNPN